LSKDLAAIEERIEQERMRLGIKEVEMDPQRLIERAVNRFNDQPIKGVEMLMERGLLQQDAKQVAQFLLETPGLSKTAVGDYLGENRPFNLQVLTEFALLQDFSNMTFDEALRSYLSSFRLPGESQKIDRMMETFAKAFCSKNPNIFASTNGCYILAFATIMLNTSLHNPSVSKKQTLEEFIKMNRGIDDGRDIDPEILTELYHSISSTPFKIPEDAEGLSTMFFNPEREGPLKKEGGTKKTWKERWVVVKESVLYYFKEKDDKSPCGIVPLYDVEAKLMEPEARHFSFRKGGEKTAAAAGKILFQLVGRPDENGVPKPVRGCKTNSKGVVVEGNHHRYLFKAETEAEAQDWVRCINASANAMFDAYRSKKHRQDETQA